jgi:pseudouridine-5'-phosphate glycosidase
MVLFTRASSRSISFVRSLHWTSLRCDLQSLKLVGKLRLGEEVQHALATNQPVVALESAIVTHGLPRGDNLAVATELEAIVRQGGAVPATIAVVDGVIHAGLTNTELSRLAYSEHSIKLSRRDIPSALSFNLTGGTTCAATMFIANKCSIKVFATGGLGGVHRGGESSTQNLHGL